MKTRASWTREFLVGGFVVFGGGCMGVLGVEDLSYDVECDGEKPVCVGNAAWTCGEDGLWKDSECVGQTCVGGACAGECGPGQPECVGNAVRECGADGFWKDSECVGQTCVGGACAGECESGQQGCLGNTPRTCDSKGNWVNGNACQAVCSGGACLVPPSCAGLPSTCGPATNESCCLSLVVPGGTYNRSNDAKFPATVSDFGLDRFEITVGRFRQFVEAYPANKPAAGAGTHPLIAESGWDAAWDAKLPVDKAKLIGNIKCDANYQTWTDTEGANENKPMNCINWYVIFAFCAWDGGRLPTEAEWNFVAAGGNEQREYPWSNPPGATVIDGSYAVYNGASIVNVGSKSPKGDGKWGHADLGGSMWEWSLDWYDNYQFYCNNCASILNGSGRVFRGGSWSTGASVLLSSGRDFYGAPTDRSYYIGGRCARTP